MIYEKVKTTVTASVWPAATLAKPLVFVAEVNIPVAPVLVTQAFGVTLDGQTERKVLTSVMVPADGTLGIVALKVTPPDPGETPTVILVESTPGKVGEDSAIIHSLPVPEGAQSPGALLSTRTAQAPVVPVRARIAIRAEPGC